jgi:hypothetical protein
MNKRTAEDIFAGCIQFIARLYLCIATVQMFIAAVSPSIALGFAFIARDLTGISNREVCIAEPASTIAECKGIVASVTTLIFLFYAALQPVDKASLVGTVAFPKHLQAHHQNKQR